MSESMKILFFISTIVLLFFSTTFGQTCQSDSIVASTQTERFSSHGDGTVTDTGTGLMWKVCSEGQSYNATSGGCDGSVASYSWQGALQRVVTVNSGGYAGHNDWRLPNLKELDSIIERQCVLPAINLEVFPATLSSGHWSASTCSDIAGYAWFINFDLGYDGFNTKGAYYVVRLVRGGQ